jgi:hypothetical protein
MNNIRHIIEVCANVTKLAWDGDVEYLAGETLQIVELEHAPEDVDALQDCLEDVLKTWSGHSTYVTIS